MIRFVLFSYDGDATVAVECVMCVRFAVPDSKVRVVDDAAHPMPPATVSALIGLGAEYVQSSWDRGGNLRGPECIKGELEELSRAATDDDIVVKIDCDTALLDDGWLRWMASRPWVQLYASGAWQEGEWVMWGACYAMRGWLTRRLLDDIDWGEVDAQAPEDRTIGSVALAILPVGLAQIVQPWSQRQPWSEWTAWNWYSLTTSAERYAARFAVVTVGNAALYGKPASERAAVMRRLLEAKVRGKETELLRSKHPIARELH